MIKKIKDVSNEMLLSFDCGVSDLNNYLSTFAKVNDKNGYGKTYLLVNKKEVIGFFTICSASINFKEYPISKKEKLPRYPIPAIKIARLGVDKKYQGKGFGKELLKLALIKSIVVSSTVGIKLVVVDAKESSYSFYEKYGFQKLKNNELTYYLTIETLLKCIDI